MQVHILESLHRKCIYRRCVHISPSLPLFLLRGKKSSMSKAEWEQHSKLQHDDTNNNSNNKHLNSQLLRLIISYYVSTNRKYT